MRESLLIIPQADNDGHSLAALRDRIAGEMCDAFGGVTETQARGMWRDSSGKLYAEPVSELVSAADDTPANVATLDKLAREILRDGNQHAVYLREPSGNVRIVESGQ